MAKRRAVTNAIALSWRGVTGLVTLAGLWAGCFYGVADLASPTGAAGAAGNTTAGDGGTSAGGGGADTGGGGVDTGGGSAGLFGCGGSDVDCEYRQRCTDADLVPRVFIGAQSGPYAVVADKNTVFWSDRDPATPGAGRIRRRGVAAGVTVDLALNQSDPGVLALDTHFVYWVTADGEVARVAQDSVVTDAGAAIDSIASAQHAPGGLVLDDTFVYWVSHTNGAVSRREKEPPRGPVQLLATSTHKPVFVAQDTTNLYWTTSGGFVETAPKTGAAPVTVLVTTEMLDALLQVDQVNGFESAGIVVDTAWIYFRARGLRAAPAKNDTGKLLRVHKDGTSLQLLVDNRAGAIAQLALDSGKLYFTTGSTGGEVWRVNSDGTGLVLLNCQAEAFPNGITTAGSRVYWTNFTGATLIWAPK